MSLDRDPQLAMWRRRRSRDTFASHTSETTTTADGEALSAALRSVFEIAEGQRQALADLSARVGELESLILQFASVKKTA